jgi:DHA1 family bicyclomycin/chloramphenicol resistance-like MFS transporter
MTLLRAAALLATAAPHLPLAAMVLSLFTRASGMAATNPPFLWLTLAHYPEIAGTASSPTGPARFAFGGLAAPLVGSGGAGTAVPIGMVTAVCGTLAVIVCVLAYAPTPGWGSTPSPGGPIDPVTANS